MSTQNAIPDEIPAPDVLMGMLFDSASFPMIKLPILQAGVELHVWANVADGHHTTEAIASAIGAEQDGIRRLLDALTVMKLLEKKAHDYHLPAWTEHYLLPGKPTYLGNFVLHWLAWEGHGQLAEAIRTGKRPIGADCTLTESVSHFLPFYAIRAAAPRRSLQRFDGYWQALQVKPRQGLQVLDLACGAGIATLALAMQHPGIHVVLQDWPVMLDFALQAARTLEVDQQVSTLPGDMFSVDYSEERFDIARLGFVTYFFAPDALARLFRKVHACLSPGGMVVVEAPLCDEDRCEREEEVLDGPWLYAISSGGDIYSFSDYASLLEEAGFRNVSQVRDGLVKATRTGATR
jgi:SAM-dependent methyltransferase